MKNMQKLNSFLEKFWLLVSIASVILVVYVYSTMGAQDDYYLLMLPVISVAMYVFRRRMSKKYAEHEE